MVRVEKRHSSSVLAVAILLLLAFFVSSVHLLNESIWYDEGWTLWAVLDVEPVFDVAPRDSVGGLIANVREMVARVRADVHPPLYFMLFDGWTMATGDSVYSGRLFSTFWGLIALAGTYALGVRLFDRKTALIACALLATSSFFIYYNREIRMYSMVLALSVLATWWYLIWSNRPTTLRMLPYMLAISALLYTHYAGAVLIVAHIAHLLVTRLYRMRLKLIWWYARPYVIAFILFAPWIPVISDQIASNPNGPLAYPIPTNLDTVGDLIVVLTSGAWLIYLALFGWAVFHLKQQRGVMSLLLIWLLIPPIALLITNATIINLYQNRYIIGILPAFMLIVACGIISLAELKSGFRSMILNLLVGLLMLLQVSNYTYIWGDKPDWEGATQWVMEARDPLQPALTHIAENSVMGYYNRQYNLRQGVALDLSWRDHRDEEMRQFVDLMQNNESVWVIMPTNVGKTWHGVGILDENYVPVYRDSVLNMIFYRFDREIESNGGDLQFRFGDVLRYDGGLATHYVVQAGEQFCPDDLIFTALRDFDDRYSIGLQIVLDHRVPIAQWDGGIGTHQGGETITIGECVDVPENINAGEYHLRLVIYEWETVANQPVLEMSGDEPILWGDHMIVASITVEP